MINCTITCATNSGGGASPAPETVTTTITVRKPDNVNIEVVTQGPVPYQDATILHFNIDCGSEAAGNCVGTAQEKRVSVTEFANPTDPDFSTLIAGPGEFWTPPGESEVFCLEGNYILDIHSNRGTDVDFVMVTIGRVYLKSEFKVNYPLRIAKLQRKKVSVSEYQIMAQP